MRLFEPNTTHENGKAHGRHIGGGDFGPAIHERPRAVRLRPAVADREGSHGGVGAMLIALLRGPAVGVARGNGSDRGCGWVDRGYQPASKRRGRRRPRDSLATGCRSDRPEKFRSSEFVDARRVGPPPLAGELSGCVVDTAVLEYHAFLFDLCMLEYISSFLWCGCVVTNFAPYL